MSYYSNNATQSSANYSWSQLLSTSNSLSTEDYDARFAAEEAELTRAGIITEAANAFGAAPTKPHGHHSKKDRLSTVEPQPTALYSWSQLSIANDLSAEEYESRFAAEEEELIRAGIIKEVANTPKATPKKSIKLSRHSSKTAGTPKTGPQPTALHSWSQLSTANDLSADEYDARFAAEEEELKRVGIIREVTPRARQHNHQTNALASRVRNATNPSDCIAAQIAWSSAREESTTHHAMGDFNGHPNFEDQESNLANVVRHANTPAACVAAQISWSQARANARELDDIERYRANHSWSQVLPSLSSTA